MMSAAPQKDVQLTMEVQGNSLPETNSKFAPEKGWVGRRLFPFGALNGLFSAAKLLSVLGRVFTSIVECQEGCKLGS